VHPITLIDGTQSLNRVTFDNVRVPISNRIGNEGEGWSYANYLLGNERTSYAHVAGKRMQMAAISDYAKSNATLASDNSFWSTFSDLEIRLDALDLTVLRVLSIISDGETPGDEASILKVLATEIAQDITELSMICRAYPAIGLFEEGVPGVEGAIATKHYFGTRAQSIYGGSNEIQKNIIAKRVLGL